MSEKRHKNKSVLKSANNQETLLRRRAEPGLRNLSPRATRSKKPDSFVEGENLGPKNMFLEQPRRKKIPANKIFRKTVSPFDWSESGPCQSYPKIFLKLPLVYIFRS